MKRSVITCFTALACLLGAPLAAAHDVPLVPHEAEYRVKISVARGVLTSRVEALPDGFVARSEIEPKGFASILMNGSIVEKSEFIVTPDGIRPQRFESVDTLSKDKENVSFDFDWSARTVDGSVGGTDFTLALDGVVHDRVSIQYELMLQLLNGRSGSEYVLLDGDELKTLVVTPIGTEQVKVPFGKFEALGIQHSKKDSSRVTTLWLSPELGYLPVIIEQRRNGKLRVRAVLTGYKALSDAKDPVVASQEALPEYEGIDAAEAALGDDDLGSTE